MNHGIWFQVIQTRRHVFAPPLGSTAAETQPSEQLLLTLEEADNRSLIQHLAYLDVCIVAESNVDTWRRTALFEESGETYKRVIDACLGPLDNLTMRLVKGLEIFESKSGDFLKQQMQLPGLDKKFQGGSIKEIFKDSQVKVSNLKWGIYGYNQVAVANVGPDNMNFTEMFNCHSLCCPQRADRIHMDVSCYFLKFTICHLHV